MTWEDTVLTNKGGSLYVYIITIPYIYIVSLVVEKFQNVEILRQRSKVVIKSKNVEIRWNGQEMVKKSKNEENIKNGAKSKNEEYGEK